MAFLGLLGHDAAMMVSTRID